VYGSFNLFGVIMVFRGVGIGLVGLMCFVGFDLLFEWIGYMEGVL